MQTVLLVLAGIVWVAMVIGVVRRVAQWGSRFIPGLREEFVYAFSLASTAYQYVEWARVGGAPGDVTLEFAGFVFFGSLAVAGLKWPLALASGWFMHAGWDWALHPMPDTTWVPYWFPDFCVGFDVFLAGYIAVKVRGLSRAQLNVRPAATAALAIAMLAASMPAAAQEHHHEHHHHTPAAESQPAESAAPQLSPFFAAILHHAGSGTSVEPPSSPVPMLMGQKGPWMWMMHGSVFVSRVEQNSPASRDMVLSNNWAMPMVGRKIGAGLFMARTMISLEPATSRFTGSPEPYQAAHDLVMEIAATYDVPLGRQWLLSLYAAPVGEPALGPSAFMHRLSSLENPLIPLSHSTQDATHQSRDVLTAGLAYKRVRVEASGFHGAAPDADRIAIEQGAIDSWSTRLTVSPTPDLTLQVSRARISPAPDAPERHDVRRMTASASYTRKLGNGFWASTLSWGHDARTPASDAAQDGYLAETTLRRGRHTVWARAETADRFLMLSLPTGHVHRTAAIQSYTGGFARDIPVAPRVETAIGVQVTRYDTPSFARSVFGVRPTVATVFLRVRPNGR